MAIGRSREGAYQFKMSIQGKHIIVTGGGSGVGKATAHKLAKEGAKITILGPG